MTNLPDPLTKTLFFCAIAAAVLNVLGDVGGMADATAYAWAALAVKAANAGLITAVAYLLKPPGTS